MGSYSLGSSSSTVMSMPAIMPNCAAQHNNIDGNEPQAVPQEYCKPSCILGVKNGWPVDLSCPNASSHLDCIVQHAPTMLNLIRHTLQAEDSPPCFDLIQINATRGTSILKMALPNTGYTFILKKASRPDATDRLYQEQQLYDQMIGLQGSSVPVCLGTFTMPSSVAIPELLNPHPIAHYMILSWAGFPLFPDIVRSDERMKAYQIYWLTREWIFQSTNIMHRGIENAYQNFVGDDICYNPYTGDFVLVGFSSADNRPIVDPQSSLPTLPVFPTSPTVSGLSE